MSSNVILPLLNTNAINLSWVTGKTYSVNDLVLSSGYLIKCLTTHTATTFTADVAAGNWSMATPMKNLVINGGFDLNQRASSAAMTGAGQYYLDRWAWNKVGSGAPTIVQDIFLIGGSSSNSMRIGWASATMTWVNVRYKFEAADIFKYIGKTITLSFKIQFSTLSGVGSTAIQVFDAAPSAIDNWTTSTNTAAGTIRGATTLAQLTAAQTKTVTYTWTVPSTVTTYSTNNGYGFEIFIAYDSATAAAPFIYLTDVMVNEGPAPAAFQTAAPNIQAELAMCQRYYEVAGFGATGRFTSASTVVLAGSFQVAKRTSNGTLAIFNATPTLQEYSTALVTNRAGTATALSAPNIGNTGFVGTFNGFTSATAGNLALCITNLVSLDAEL
jgi:hypothetical protein